MLPLLYALPALTNLNQPWPISTRPSCSKTSPCERSWPDTFVRKAFRAIRMVRTFRLFKGASEKSDLLRQVISRVLILGSPHQTRNEIQGLNSDFVAMILTLEFPISDLKLAQTLSRLAAVKLRKRSTALGEGMHLLSAFTWLVDGTIGCFHATWRWCGPHGSHAAKMDTLKLPPWPPWEPPGPVTETKLHSCSHPCSGRSALWSLATCYRISS